MPGKPQDTHAQFKETMVHAVDRGFLTLGEVMIEPLYALVDTSYGVKREEVLEKLPKFHMALQEIMGAGAGVMERQIAKSLYAQLGQEFANYPNWTLIDYVNDAKRKCGIGS